MNYIGLKYFWQQYKGCSLKTLLYEFRWELHYAWRRFWIGYDDVDVFDIYGRFQQRMLAVLEDYQIHHTGRFRVPDELVDFELYGEKYIDEVRYFNANETNMIIDTMIWHLKMTDEDFCMKRLYPNEEKLTIEQYKRVFKIMEQNKDAFMELFRLFYFNLWD